MYKESRIMPTIMPILMHNYGFHLQVGPSVNIFHHVYCRWNNYEMISVLEFLQRLK